MVCSAILVEYFTYVAFNIYYRCCRGRWCVDGRCRGSHGNNSTGIIWWYQ